MLVPELAQALLSSAATAGAGLMRYASKVIRHEIVQLWAESGRLCAWLCQALRVSPQIARSLPLLATCGYGWLCIFLNVYTFKGVSMILTMLPGT